MSTPNRTTIQGKDQQVIVGIQKELQSMPALYLGSQMFTPQTLEAFVQRRIDLGRAILTAKAAWEHAVATYETASPQTDLVIADLRHAVIGAFGRDSEKLATFGFVAPKLRVLSPEQRALAAKRAKATRKARNTMGKRQKALIKGEVPAAVAVAAPAGPATPGAAPTTPSDGSEVGGTQ
jgi:hypothetical protein